MLVSQTPHLRDQGESAGYMAQHIRLGHVGSTLNLSTSPNRLSIVFRVRGGRLLRARALSVMNTMCITRNKRLQAACSRW